MDARCMKARDFVAISRNWKEEVHKGRYLQIKWLKKYEWLLDERIKLKEEMEKLCKEKQTIITATEEFVREEGKTCLPTPITSSGEYGWLASKPKFQLEKYGAYRPQYPDPFKDVEQLRGKMPILAPGKGFMW